MDKQQVEEIMEVVHDFILKGKHDQAAAYLRVQPKITHKHIFAQVVKSGDLNTVVFVKQTHPHIEITYENILSAFEEHPDVGVWLVQNAEQNAKEQGLIFSVQHKNDVAYKYLRAQKDIDITCRSGAVLLAASSNALPHVIDDVIHHFTKEDRVCALHWAAEDISTVETLLKHQVVETEDDKIAIQNGLHAICVTSVKSKNTTLVDFLAPFCDIPAVFQILRSNEINTEVLDQYCNKQQKTLLLDKIKAERASIIENEAPVRKM